MMQNIPPMIAQSDLGHAQVPANNVKQMAYGQGTSTNSPYRTFRVERGKPVYRRGVQVIVTPQFKGLTLYSPTTTNVAFKQTVTNTAIVWPGNHLTP